ncbi:putative cobalamin binding protein [Desulfosporosinus orientis DSM 765]|uniref:Putative cobalamin binding protein n=1 Tax=Desulfosporosinus orientis (strain ATCC 19365 / DSM 765 / NCIMB 8382 / VKM B-1628 / Singapore I) TaxID=768706 RepID=G7WD13_DESOD|nr:corrinoid protein [Desulfosporosinus orientis]AET67208.1 putative cobalamin binding protein [Desulfosporosinus orientis DSM 765]
MAKSKEELLKELSDCVFEMEDDNAAGIAEEYIDAGYEALDGVLKGLVDGMNRAGQMYEEEEYFVTDLLVCSDAMYNGLAVLRPHLPQEKDSGAVNCKCVIGVVEGDTHDIGKNLVRIMLETAGFEMYDLGRDVPLKSFVEKAKEVDAQLICLSTLMTTTMPGMKEVVDMLKEEGLRDKVKVMIGGGPISQAYCDQVNADGYAVNATAAVTVAKELFGMA